MARDACWRASGDEVVSVSLGPSPGVPVRSISCRWLNRLVFSPSILPLDVMPQVDDGDFDFCGLWPVTRLLHWQLHLHSLRSSSSRLSSMLSFLRFA